MAASLNRVLLIGNLTRDPELRYIPSGQGVATFTIACNRTYTGTTGEKKEDVSFIRCVVWGKRAEVCNEYLRKGSPVFVEGRLQSRSWDAPDGTKKSAVEVVAMNVQFLGRGDRQTSGASHQAPEPPETIIEDSFDKTPVDVPNNELKPDEEISIPIHAPSPIVIYTDIQDANQLRKGIVYEKDLEIVSNDISNPIRFIKVRMKVAT